jgi:hypothetical protein
MSQWIKVKDKRPKEETPVLIVWRGEIRIGEIRWEYPTHEDSYQAFPYWDDPNDDGKDWEWPDITHWQPLPEVPA